MPGRGTSRAHKIPQKKPTADCADHADSKAVASSRFPVLSSRFSVPSSQFSVLGSQFLSSRFSVRCQPAMGPIYTRWSCLPHTYN